MIRSLEPDNTDNIKTFINVVYIECNGVGSLLNTLDDYLANLQVALRVRGVVHD